MPPVLVALLGSPRRGNSRALLDAVVEGARSARPDVEVHVVEAYGVRVGPCDACRACEGPDASEGCATEDDDWPRIEALLRAADALVVASPVYFRGLPAPLKAIVDRLQAMWMLRERGGRVAANAGPHRRAAVVLVAGQGRGMFDGARGEVSAATRTLGFEAAGELLAEGLEGSADASGRPDLLNRARALGRALLTV